MSERFDAVDAQDRYLEPVTRKQLGITFDIDLFQPVKLNAACLANLCFHFFTEVAARL